MLPGSQHQHGDTLAGAIILSATARTQKIVIAGILAVYETLTVVTGGPRTLTCAVASNA